MVPNDFIPYIHLARCSIYGGWDYTIYLQIPTPTAPAVEPTTPCGLKPTQMVTILPNPFFL